MLLAGDRVLDRAVPASVSASSPDADDAVGLVHHERRQCGLVAGVVLLRDLAEDRPDQRTGRLLRIGGLLDLGTELGVLDEAW